MVCIAASTRLALETRQREAGRTALEVHGGTPNEAIQGDLGWSSFEAREATAKLAYELRLSGLPDGRWAREVYKYLHLRSVNTKWVTRTRRLAERYETPTVSLTEPPQRGGRQKVRELVKKAELKRWHTQALAKSALTTYCASKEIISREPLYDNSRGSALLFEARSGVLRTRALRAKYGTTWTQSARCVTPSRRA